jgi:adenosylmethionine-8-amino-7-oxononanoate aminotransferase
MSFHSWQNRGRREKQEFLCLAGSYHGETVGALAVTDVALFKDAYAPLMRPASTVPARMHAWPEAGESAVDVARRAAAALEAISSTITSAAALIVEPLMQCASGMAMYDPEYLRLARSLCDRYEVHLICDEIAVGCGRTGTFFAHQQAAITPDFLCLSKGISGGYLPLSIVMTTDAVYADFYDDATSRGFPPLALLHRQRAGLPRGAGNAGHLRRGSGDRANRSLAGHLADCLQPLAGHPQVRHCASEA